MANKQIFKSVPGRTVAPANTRNEAGGLAYSLSDEAALAQILVTGTFNNVYYATAEDRLSKVQELASKVSSEFLAKAAVYAAQEGKMKDMPAYACAVLASRGGDGLPYLTAIFDRVLYKPKMLYNFVQIVRSGVTGRKSFGTAVKRLILNWLANRTDEQVFLASIGHADPSLADVIKMVHPRPTTKSRTALYAYLIGKEYSKRDLPLLVRQYEEFKAGNRKTVPDLPFMVLSNLPLTDEHWKDIAVNAPWNTLRMNLNNFGRHGVFNDTKTVDSLASKLADENEVRRSSVFPYQIMTAYQNVSEDIPMKLTNALQDAMEVATENVPSLNGKKVLVAVDVSGSMGSPITGHRVGSTSKVRCVDVAALIASTVIRKNPDAEVYAFDTGLYRARLNPRDSIMTNASHLSKYGGGGTNCSLPLQHWNQQKMKADVIIYVSDNESWADFGNASRYRYYGGTGSAQGWAEFKARNPKAKLVLIDLQPYTTTQVKDDRDVLNIGGFSDTVFDVINSFVNGSKDHFVDVINKVKL